MTGNSVAKDFVTLLTFFLSFEPLMMQNRYNLINISFSFFSILQTIMPMRMPVNAFAFKVFLQGNR